MTGLRCPATGARVNAPVAAALAERAEAVCRHPAPRRQGRYRPRGARGRSLRRENSPIGDLRHRPPTLRAALDEARAFLALPPAAPARATARLRRDRTPSMGHTRSAISTCRFRRFHAALRYRERRHRQCDGTPRSGGDSVVARPSRLRQGRWPIRARRSGASSDTPCASAAPPRSFAPVGASDRVVSGDRSAIGAAAALSRWARRVRAAAPSRAS